MGGVVPDYAPKWTPEEAKLIAEQNKALADRDLAHDAACELVAAKEGVLELAKLREILRVIGLLAHACPENVPSASIKLLLLHQAYDLDQIHRREADPA